MAETPVPRDPRELPRVLGFWDGLAISVGVVIGSGIFMTGPGVCAQFTSVTPVNASANTPKESSMILGALLLGFPVYSVWRRLTRPQRRPVQVPTAP